MSDMEREVEDLSCLATLAEGFVNNGGSGENL